GLGQTGGRHTSNVSESKNADLHYAISLDGVRPSVPMQPDPAMPRSEPRTVDSPGAMSSGFPRADAPPDRERHGAPDRAAARSRRAQIRPAYRPEESARRE